MNCHSPSFLVLYCTTRCLRRTYLFFVSCIYGTPFELSQSHFSYAARPEDPEPLTASRYPDLIISLNFARFLMVFLLEIWTYIRPWCWFLASWIGPSFVKTHGLSLLFMEWAFLWNFGSQQGSTPKCFYKGFHFVNKIFSLMWLWYHLCFSCDSNIFPINYLNWYVDQSN